MTTNSITKAKSVLKIQDWKKHQNLALTTCYDAWSAKIIAESTIDAVLVGDSAAMVMQDQIAHSTFLFLKWLVT